MGLRYLCKNGLKLCRSVYASITMQYEYKMAERRAESRRVHAVRMRTIVKPQKLGLSLFCTRIRNTTLCHIAHQNSKACNEFSMPIEYILNGRLCSDHKLPMNRIRSGRFRTAPIFRMNK